MPGGIPNGRSLRLLVSSLWRAAIYVVRIVSLILGDTSPCARMLKKMARAVGLTWDVSGLRLDLLCDAISLMNISSESNLFPGTFARFSLEMMSVIWFGDICIFFLLRVEPLVFICWCGKFNCREEGLRSHSMLILLSSIAITGRLLVNRALSELKLLLSHAT